MDVEWSKNDEEGAVTLKELEPGACFRLPLDTDPNRTIYLDPRTVYLKTRAVADGTTSTVIRVKDGALVSMNLDRLTKRLRATLHVEEDA